MNIWFGYWIVYAGYEDGSDLEGNDFYSTDSPITSIEAMNEMRHAIAKSHGVAPDKILFKSFNRV